MLLGCAVLAGCTHWQYNLGLPLHEDAIDSEPGALSLGRVLTILGPPQRLSAIPGGYVMAWEHWQVSEKSIGISLGALGVEGLSLDWGQAQVDAEFLLLTMNSNHKLVSHTFSKWSGDAGGGSAVQPFVGLVSVVDVEDLVKRMPHHNWGGDILKPLPRAINSASAPDLGHSGIEQRGTPTGVGQRSLEMR